MISTYTHEEKFKAITLEIVNNWMKATEGTAEAQVHPNFNLVVDTTLTELVSL